MENQSLNEQLEKIQNDVCYVSINTNKLSGLLVKYSRTENEFCCTIKCSLQDLKFALSIYQIYKIQFLVSDEIVSEISSKDYRISNDKIVIKNIDLVKQIVFVKIKFNLQSN